MSAGQSGASAGDSGTPSPQPAPRVVLQPTLTAQGHWAYDVLLDTMVVGQVGDPPWFTEVRDVLAPITPDAAALARGSQTIRRPDADPVV